MEKIPIPCFLIQPLVENAIKHGIAPAISGGKILVSIEQGDSLCIRVEDNRKEKIVSRIETEREKTGLKNIKRRLLLTYGDQSGFTLEVNALGALATLKIKV